MSLQEFQHALVHLLHDASSVRRLASGDEGVLIRYSLTRVEKARLRSVVDQPGIWLCCSLTRATRLEPVVEAFPMTCVLLEPHLRDLMDGIWERHGAVGYQLQGEEHLFVEQVERMLRLGPEPHECLREVFDYEQTCWRLAHTLRRGAGESGSSGVVVFQHRPDQVLQPLAALMAPPAGLPRQTHRVRISIDAAGEFHTEVLT